MANGADVQNLKAERSDAITLLRSYTAAFVAAGSPADFQVSVDGESFDWSDYRAKKLREIQDLTALINQMSAPWVVRTRGR